MQRVIIIGAAGRDFHNFNTYFRENADYRVVAFTAAQIPDIDDRLYPKELAGENYPDGIPIYSEDELEKLIVEKNAGLCVFAYSDVPYNHVMHMSARVNAAGASFCLLGPNDTMIKSNKPLISVCAARTGCGKSQTSRQVIQLLMQHGLKVVAVRHPMPYGDLARQKVQRFATVDDLLQHKCTIEEMEEYEPHIERGNVVYAGVDYQAIINAAENDPGGCDVIVWDGGNNDFSFYNPDLAITVADPHRAGHELSYYPGEVNLRMADVVVINKIDSANATDVRLLRQNIRAANPRASIIEGASPIYADKPEAIKGQRVLVIEDGPTLTHGEMSEGAGIQAAYKYGAAEIIDPRPYAVGQLAETYQKYPHIGKLLPAMGYSDEQLNDLQATIAACPCDTVIIGTPIDLKRVIPIAKPGTRIRYELQAIGQPGLKEMIDKFVQDYQLKGVKA